jgi:hypothetical protein
MVLSCAKFLEDTKLFERSALALSIVLLAAAPAGINEHPAMTYQSEQKAAVDAIATCNNKIDAMEDGATPAADPDKFVRESQAACLTAYRNLGVLILDEKNHHYELEEAVEAARAAAIVGATFLMLEREAEGKQWFHRALGIVNTVQTDDEIDDYPGLFADAQEVRNEIVNTAKKLEWGTNW